MATLKRQLAYSALALALLACAQIAGIGSVAAAPIRVAFLGLRLQNDNEKFEPTTEAERNRLALWVAQF